METTPPIPLPAHRTISIPHNRRKQNRNLPTVPSIQLRHTRKQHTRKRAKPRPHANSHGNTARTLAPNDRSHPKPKHPHTLGRFPHSWNKRFTNPHYGAVVRNSSQPPKHNPSLLKSNPPTPKRTPLNRPNRKMHAPMPTRNGRLPSCTNKQHTLLRQHLRRQTKSRQLQLPPRRRPQTQPRTSSRSPTTTNRQRPHL